MLLSILIPTYNRVSHLKKNINSLASYICNNDFALSVSIIVSNNASVDGTKLILDDLKNKWQNIVLDIYDQNENIGLENNALFVLEKATSKYVMYLGDDDYIDENYFIDVVKKLQIDDGVHCILPSFRHIDIDGKFRAEWQMEGSSHIDEPGFENCLKNSCRGHQLSGIVLYRNGLKESYVNKKINNLYPFIYFVSYCCLQGKTWCFLDYPVLVTVIDQKNKDWGYGKDGLISHIFDNYQKLDITKHQRHLLEMKMLESQSWRYTMYGKCGFLRAIWNIERSEKTSYLTKLIFPCFVLRLIFKKMVN